MPYLLGFVPRRSLVLVFTCGRRILLTARHDLVPAGRVSASCAASCATGTRSGARWVFPVVFDEDLSPAAEVLSGIGLAVRQAARAAGLDCGELVLASGRRWARVPADRVAGESSESGEILDPDGVSAAASFVAAGIGYVSRREDLDEWLVPARADRHDQIPVPASASKLARAGTAAGRRWRRETEDDLLAWLGAWHPRSGRPAPERAGRWLAGLADSRVREPVLRRVMFDDGPLAESLGVEPLAELVRLAPPGHVAPVASCVSALVWHSGSGPKALVAADVALADDPRCTLARLVRQAVRAGMPPSEWSQIMANCTLGALRGTQSADEE